MSVIIVLGGGASGMTAAISAAVSESGSKTKIILIEHGDRLGRKILVTGNGKCNLTNKNMDASHYRGNDPNFVKTALSLFGSGDTERFFESIGVLLKEKNGYVYPYSEQAATVNDALRAGLSKAGADIRLNTNVTKIKASDNHFELYCENGTKINGDRLIIATGSKAFPKTGSDGSGYGFAKALGHSVIKPLPALVQLICKGDFFKGIAGVRVSDAEISLKIDGGIVRERGELQLTEYGISGIPVFQISRYAVRALNLPKESDLNSNSNLRADSDNKRSVMVKIDFLPNLAVEKISEFMRAHGNMTAEEILNGILNKKLTVCILKLAGVRREKLLKTLADNELKNILTFLKEFEVSVISSKSFDMAQVCSGGVDTSEINEKTMESKIIKGLYFAGEIMDVDGECGGYNLQWAWTSGFLAGRNAAL